ncbi:MAG: Uma2 family endonuclease [Hyphomicrobiaceae bacterium]|nr:Uma2 family endonuclease [Hyphomicrobiaceae bacterium]
MNAPLINLKADRLATLSWQHAAPRPIKVERAPIAPRSTETRSHARIAAGFCAALRAVLAPAHWDVLGGTLAVETGGEVRYPDAVVDSAASGAMSTATPLLIVEVLSPFSTGLDFTVKLAEYLSLDALETYIVASQDEPIVWVWQRSEANREFVSQPVEVYGRQSVIELEALGVLLPLSEIYRGASTA